MTKTLPSLFTAVLILLVTLLFGSSVLSAQLRDRAPQSLIRYDVYVNGELRAVVVGNATAQVEVDFGVNNVTVIAVDTADNESAPGRPF